MVRVTGMFINMNLPGVEDLPYTELKKNSFDKIDRIDLDGLLPDNPGVYFFIDFSGEVIYIGEAGNIRTRVKRNHNVLNNHRADVISISWLALPFGHDLERFILEKAYIIYYKPRLNDEIRNGGMG